MEPKEEQRQAIIELYRQGLVPSEILKELHNRGFQDIKTLAGVKSRIHHLRQKGLLGYRDERYKGGEKNLSASASAVTSSKLARFTVWVERDTIKAIKSLAETKGVTASAMVREIFGGFLK